MGFALSKKHFLEKPVNKKARRYRTSSFGLCVKRKNQA